MRITRRILETRDDPGISITEEPIAELRTALDGFTQTAETRLAAADAAVAELRGRLDRTEATLRRPATGTTATRGEKPIEQRAFIQWMRTGGLGMDPVETRALRVSDSTAGGYLAPDQFIAEVQRNLVLFSPVRSVARVSPTSAPAVLLPLRTSGMTAQWVPEVGPRPETTTTFGQNRFEVREVACWIDVSNQLLEDSAINLEAEISFDFAEEFGRAEGAAFVNGNGVTQPQGFMSDPRVGYVPSGSASTITADNLLDLFSSIPAPYRANAVFAMNATTLASFRKLKDTTGNYLLITQGIAGSPATTILGQPVIEMPDMPNVGAGASPVVFGDFNAGYRIFDRVELAVLRDPYTQAINGITRFHARRRVAGGVARPDALKKLTVATS